MPPYHRRCVKLCQYIVTNVCAVAEFSTHCRICGLQGGSAATFVVGHLLLAFTQTRVVNLNVFIWRGNNGKYLICSFQRQRILEGEELREMSQVLRIEVHDNGPGISPVGSSLIVGLVVCSYQQCRVTKRNSSTRSFSLMLPNTKAEEVLG